MAIVPRNKFIEREAYKNSKSLQLIFDGTNHCKQIQLGQKAVVQIYDC